MSNYKTTQKEQAKYLYLSTSHTQKAIANHLGITEKTMWSWIKKGDWTELKKKTYHSPEQELHQLYEELRTINANINGRAKDKRFATKEELETKTKILALISGPLKNTADTWRNIAPHIECQPITERAQQSSKNEPTTVNGYHDGAAPWSEDGLKSKYDQVAYWLALADHETEQYAKENNLPFNKSF